jgi:hypothetical protein
MTARPTTFPAIATGAYVRHFYGVPAEKGMRVRVNGQPGVIVGFVEAYLRVRFDCENEPVNAHPTWRVLYGEDAR